MKSAETELPNACKTKRCTGFVGGGAGEIRFSPKMRLIASLCLRLRPMIEDAFEVEVVLLICRSSLDRIESRHAIGDRGNREFLENGGRLDMARDVWFVCLVD